MDTSTPAESQAPPPTRLHRAGGQSPVRRLGFAAGVVAVCVVVLFVVRSCSPGASDAPTDATTAGFCQTYNTIQTTAFGAAQPDASATEQNQQTVQGFKKWAKAMVATGTPTKIPDPARDGFEAYLDTIAALPDTTDISDLAVITNKLSKGDQNNYQQFIDYVTTTCTPTGAGG